MGHPAHHASGHAKQATVIGGHGFIGSALVRQLTQDGWQCWVPTRGEAWLHDASGPALASEGLGHVFYCAGLTADYYQRPAYTVDAHIGLLAHVLQHVHYTSLVYLSSTRLYDSMHNAVHSGTSSSVSSAGSAAILATEDASLCVNPQKPRHFYDLTKLTGESLCHALGAGRARVARLACVYDNIRDNPSPGSPTREAGGFLPSLLAQVQGTPLGGTVRVDSSPHFARDYVHLSDVLRALVDIATHKAAPAHSTYNVASGVNLRNDTLAQWIEAHSGRRIVFTQGQNDPHLTQAQQPQPSVAAVPAQVCVQRLCSTFGWSPRPVAHHLTPWLQHLGGTTP